APAIRLDHDAVVSESVSQARESAGSFIAAGAIVGAIVGARLALVFVIVGGDAIRQNLVAIIIGAPILVFAFAAIGALAGRAKLFQSRNYERYESAVDRGEALVTVSGSPELLQRSRRILEEHGALRFRHEETGEAI